MQNSLTFALTVLMGIIQPHNDIQLWHFHVNVVFVNTEDAQNAPLLALT